MTIERIIAYRVDGDLFADASQAQLADAKSQLLTLCRERFGGGDYSPDMIASVLVEDIQFGQLLRVITAGRMSADDRDQLHRVLSYKLEAFEDFRGNPRLASLLNVNINHKSALVYIGDLVQKDVHELLRYPNFGRKSLWEVQEFLKFVSLSLGVQLLIGMDLFALDEADRMIPLMHDMPAQGPRPTVFETALDDLKYLHDPDEWISGMYALTRRVRDGDFNERTGS